MTTTATGFPAASTASTTAQDSADRTGRHRRPWTSRIPALLETLAYTGAAVDPTLALAARRFARVRDEALRVR